MNANPQSAIPLYFQIEQGLASLITSATLAPGSQLPSEEELVQRYGVSRTTVRKAVQELDRLGRSEEHTSELQSPDHLVCRLLLEKKKTTRYAISVTSPIRVQTGDRNLQH